MRKLLILVAIVLQSCSAYKNHVIEEVKPTVTIEGRAIEVIYDNYGNAYLKQQISEDGSILYIPTPYTIDVSDTMKTLIAKK